MAEKEDKVLELLDQLKEKYGKFLDDTASEAGDGSGLHFDLTGNNVISGDEIYIEALYIKPEHQGKGIGKEIVDELKKLSNDINVPITLIDFSKEGPEGVSFWEQLGFYDAADTGEGDGTIYRPDTPTNVGDDTSPVLKGREGLPITAEQDRMFEIKWADHWATKGDMWGVQVHGTSTAEVIQGFYTWKSTNPDIPNWWFPRDLMNKKQLEQIAFIGFGVSQEDIDDLKEGFEKGIFDIEKDKELLSGINELDGSSMLMNIDTPTNVVDEDNLPIPEDASEIEFIEQENNQRLFDAGEDLPIDEDVLKQQVAARQLGYGDDELKIIEGTAFKEIMDDMDAKGINYSNVDIYSYIPESERLTPYLIFMEDVRNRWYTDEFVEYLVKVSAAGAFENIGYKNLPFSPAAQIHEHALNISFRRGPVFFENMLFDVVLDQKNPKSSLRPSKLKINYINDIFPGGSYKAYLEEDIRRFWADKGMTPEGKWLPEIQKQIDENIAFDDIVKNIDTPTNVVDDFNKLIEDVFDEFEAANNLYEPETGKTYIAHADFAEIIGKKYNMPDNELDSLLMIIVDNQMKDKNRPYMVSRDTFKENSNVAKSVEDYINGKPVTIEKSFTDQQQTMFAGTYQRKLPDTPDRPFGPGAAHIEEILNANTQLVNELPLSTTVKNQFNNLVQGKAKNLATPGGVADAVDVWELGVLGLMIAAVAYKEYDEIPTILTNKAVDMFNSMTGSYGIPPVPKEQYDLDYEFINKVVETGEKFMPTDIIIKKVGDVVKGAAETGAVTGFGYVPPNLTKTDTMETTQKIQPGVQEEKMFEQTKPKKSSGGAGAKIL